MAGDQASENWIAARDTAVLMLLYGAGLRIGEALGLMRKDAPTGDSIKVLGKGSKERMVPIMPIVRDAIGDCLDKYPVIYHPARLFLEARVADLSVPALSKNGCS